MCGITGHIDSAMRRSDDANRRLTEAMADTIRHRGPDGWGIWGDKAAGVYLAHRRLAIVDLSDAGAQPMATPDGRGHLSYNGEAYNAPALRPELERAGYVFRGHSDSEVILYGCHKWGVIETARRLWGMFAFAYWDQQDRRLWLVRDRLGKKPIYWTKSEGSFAFASEIRPLLLHPETPREIDRSSVAEYLRTSYIAAPHSIIDGIHKLEPGAALAYSPETGDVRIERYWQLEDALARGHADPFSGSPQDAVAEAEALLSDATRIRLMSDVPLGAFLSGGVDSSVVTALMQQQGGGSTRTFSIGYQSAEYDEGEDAARVAAHLGTNHTRFTLEPRDAMAIVPNMAQIFDEPFADASQIPTFMVSKLAREHVTVALTGDGGDEVFAGYNRHAAAGGMLGRLGTLPRPIRSIVARGMTALSPRQWQRIFQVVPASMRPRAAGEKIHKLAPLLRLDSREQYRRVTSLWHDPASVVVKGSERLGVIDDKQLTSMFRDQVEEFRYLDLATYLPGDILTKVDRASMAVSLETRAPLLDHRLVEFSFRLPSSVHLNQGRTKWILRQILERYVPRELFERPKMGFAVPIESWLRSDLRDWAESLLDENVLIDQGLLRPEPIRALWQQHLSGRVNAQYELWNVLMLNAWVDAYAKDLRAPHASAFA
ncbi:MULTISPECIES: asparagine synthase (glutamine-hydrolyzing) [unclassified Sphingomonas]|uniref:asparagine synthase (glutamine-hydrolyzing) n=1 Tax=unclassified Sphingomonas TaxID=196159 RepID=UPI0006F4531F|nr:MULTISPECIES: asparagine synthase (glutamine-hydrolyzing) [unclassified Sphingomonas]KQM23666.1 asparagine synthase [Sphingomonas sp. Leaf9]KQM41840.1 asparagine synthase [Sphingomonas sp. Leaf11]